MESAHQDPRSAHRGAERRRRRADLGHAARSPPGTPGGDEDACRERGQEREQAEAPEPVLVQIQQPDASPIQTLREVGGPLVAPIATAGLVVVFVIFMLLQREDLRDRVLRWSAPATSPAPPKP